EILTGRAPECREVVADDQGVDAAAYPALGEIAERDLAPSGEAQDGARHDQPERGHRAQRVDGAHRLARTEWRARARVEEVQRHLVRVELGQLGREFGALLDRLAHAEDPAAT